LKRKKSNLKKTDFINYYTKERLSLTDKTIDKIISDMYKQLPEWKALLEISFLPDDLKEKYLKLLDERISRF